jgi:hypothetical protein
LEKDFEKAKVILKNVTENYYYLNDDLKEFFVAEMKKKNIPSSNAVLLPRFFYNKAFHIRKWD